MTPITKNILDKNGKVILVLGEWYRTRIYEFAGIAVSYTTHVTGSDRVFLERMNDKGELYGNYFDIETLEKVEEDEEEKKNKKFLYNDKFHSLN